MSTPKTLAVIPAQPLAPLEQIWGDGCCAACGANDCVVLDHDHGSGLVRGYLCRSCNIREGYGHGDRGLWEYLVDPPASQSHLPPLVYEGFGRASTLWTHVFRCRAIDRLSSDCGEACRELRERLRADGWYDGGFR